MRIIYQHKKIKDYHIDLVECEPSVRNLRFCNDLKKSVDIYFLSFPYVQIATRSYYKGELGEIHIGLSKKPFCPNNNPKCYVPPLPNCYANFSVCGISAINAENAAQLFWNSRFHFGEYAGCNYLIKSSMKNIKIWQKMTLIAPEFIVSEGCNYGNKPKDFINTITDGYYDYDDDDY